MIKNGPWILALVGVVFLLAAVVSVEVSTWNECRAHFSWLYCVTRH